MKAPSPRARFILLIALVSGLGTLTLTAHLQGWLTTEDIRELVAAGGIWSPVVYLLLAPVLLVAWCPRSLLSMVAGALFGVALGGSLALIMGATGSLGSYLLGVKLGHPYLSQKSREGWSQRIVRFIQRRGFWAVVVCRVCPLVPSELISVTSGVTAIPLPRYVAATVLGMAPGAFLYAAFGASLLDPDKWWITVAALGAFVVLALVTGSVMVRLWRTEAISSE